MSAGIVLLSLMLPEVAKAQSTTNTKRLTGTYTNMTYNRESGGVFGQELDIVVTPKGYEGALQMAEGVPGELAIVNIDINGKDLKFDIPDSADHPGQFVGTIEGSTLRGQFRFKNGEVANVVLKKGKSYWD